MFSLLEAAENIITQGKCFCLITIVETRGSTPRDVGAQMLVTETQDYFSIGGGNLEMQAMQKAREMLAAMSGPQELDYILGPDMEQCCGGTVKLDLKIIQGLDALAALQAAAKAPLYLFGAGHVGTALKAALTPLPFALHIYDSRSDKDALGLDDIETVIGGAPNDALFLVMTHDHAQDYDLVRAILRREQVRFCGMIGSKTKRARFMARLKKDGLTEKQIARLTCPIGIEGIEGKEPQIIAASVAAQLLQQLGDLHEH